MESFNADSPFSDFRHQLNDRLLNTRTVVLNEALTASVAGVIAKQLTILEAESSEPIQFVMTNAPGGETESALSTYDLIRSLTAPTTMVGTGRISGAGVIAFVAAPAERRFALPHVHFRLEEPQGSIGQGASTDIEAEANAAADLRGRVVTLLSRATGESEAQVQEDVAANRGFDAAAAVEYGLIHRVVESRSEIS